ncbi:TPA: DUF722 domain-containing protein [Streptococcus equi subsp. zooepidemicus]|nr:DUF722 domain-containing protein [Streptococcus equi subsp. zooepidemicus]HEL1155943.1 DUF722 domain-containing protein [Streptococcus equi subsp. zooepidemicus]
MASFSKRKLDSIDVELQWYRTIDNRIYSRRQELIHNKKYGYEKQIKGKGNKTNSPTENTIIRLEEDVTLRYLEGFKLLVETLMNELIDTDLIIFKMRFLKEGMTWDDVAFELNRSIRDINKRRKIIAEKFVELKGY